MITTGLLATVPMQSKRICAQAPVVVLCTHTSTADKTAGVRRTIEGKRKGTYLRGYVLIDFTFCGWATLDIGMPLYATYVEM